MNETAEAMSNNDLFADIDNDWNDVVADTGAQEPAAADTGKAETPAEPAAEPEPKADEPAAADPQPELFTLKNRDETRQVSREELIAMAQKGWDYDAVRDERDQLRTYRAEADPALALVKDYAARMGMDIPQYLDYCREQELKMGGKTETEAKNIVAQEKREASLQAREKAIAAKEQAQTSAEAKAQEAAQARQRNIQDFFKAYPKVDPKDIPREVWNDVLNNGHTLTSAYTMHENRRIQAEMSRLQAELAAEKQNKTNQSLSPGSLGGTSVTDMDEIDRLWAEDD